MKIYSFKCFSRASYLFIFFISLISFNIATLYSQESYLQDIQIDTSTKPEDEKLDLPTNPFELVEMIRKANSMNDATKPSDAIDEALKSFDMIEEKNNL